MKRPSEFGKLRVAPYAEADANFRLEDIAATLHGSLEDGINVCVEGCNRQVAPGRIALEWEARLVVAPATPTNNQRNSRRALPTF